MLLYFYLIILVVGLTSAMKDPIVSIKNGLIRGKSHGHYYSFEGIPYAESPTGENRFEPPIPYPRSWSDVADATKLHESCIQLHVYPVEKPNITSPPRIFGSEDCLYLNIYTPDIESYKHYPVLFYIHGGGFMFGSGGGLREKILMEHQSMILVTFNYRVGPFGFLSTGDDVISGNMGLKDQQVALKWVKENIESFNGDPNKIILTGFSAGAASVEYQLLQPGIENYVSAAISFSGSVLCPWAFVQDPLKNALKMADILKCPKGKDDVITTQKIKNCLQFVPSKHIVLAVHKYQSFLYNPIRVGPVIEPKSVKNAFITDNPVNLIKNGSLPAHIPWLASVVAQEGTPWFADFMTPGEQGEKIREEFNTDPKKIFSLMFLIDENRSEKEASEYVDKIWEKYNLPEKFTETNADKFIRAATDIAIKDKIYESLKLHAKYGLKTYGYIYDNPADYGWGHFISGNTNDHFGTTHGDDVFLILNYRARDLKKHPFREDEKENSNKFVKMIEHFALTGNLQFGNFFIENITPERQQIAKITGKSISMEDF